MSYLYIIVFSFAEVQSAIVLTNAEIPFCLNEILSYQLF